MRIRIRSFWFGVCVGAVTSGLFAGSTLWIFGEKYLNEKKNETEDDTIEEEEDSDILNVAMAVPASMTEDDMKKYRETLEDLGYDTEV